MLTNCCFCGSEIEKASGAINRAQKVGMLLFCDQVCFGLYHREWKSDDQKKADKAAYDAKYRENRKEILKKSKAEYFKKDYAANPKKYKAERQRRMKSHIEYCRNPEYQKKKKSYDQKHRAEKFYGAFAEAAIILFQIEGMIDAKLARADKDCNNKSTKRKRLWKSLQQSV